MPFANLDSGQTVFFERELEHVKSKTYDKMKRPLRAFELIPVDSTAGAGDETIVYQSYDMVGMAKVIANYADDLPRADVHGEEFVAKIKSVGNSYGYNLQEIRAAQKAGKSLEARKSDAAVRSQQETWNKVAFFGDAEHNLPGWLTNPNIPSASAPADGTGSATTFASKTPAQILRDLNDLVNGIITLTKGYEKPDTLVLPLEQYTLIHTTVFGSASDDSIAQVFLKNSPYITSIEWAVELSSTELAANGVTDFTGNIAIAYRRDPECLTFEMPVMFEQLAVQERNLEFVVPCHSRIAGVIVYYPLSMSILEGI